ncbi:MAG TPA: sulfite exporter TauE/SafE family protein [Rubrobacter sp.]|nr:sulfite exporter TauE/SafE family protein [Rubrobacter sp.]
MSRRASSGPLLTCFMLAFAMLTLLPSRTAEAHPLGNFTINHYSRIQFSDEAAHIKYVLDFAEIPTLQQRRDLDPDGDGKLSGAEAAAYLDAELPNLLNGLQLRVAGEALPLQVLDRSASYRPGQGGLPTLRVEANLLADLPTGWEEHGASQFSDQNYEGRVGWQEIVVKGGPGVVVKDSTAPTTDVSNELRSYPRDSLSSPSNHRAATFTLTTGEGTAMGASKAQLTEGMGMNNSVTDRAASLISVDRLSPTVVAILILTVLLWGAGHALTPGHGKTIVAAYLVGTRGTVRHAAILGLTVTLTHTAGVFALGMVTLFLSRFILPEQLYPWLGVASGILVLAVGSSLLYRRLRRVLWIGSEKRGLHTRPNGAGKDTPLHNITLVAARHHHQHAHAHHSIEHHHEHANPGPHHHHVHSHLPSGADGSKMTMRGLLALGVSGGLLPCPAALVLLLSAISLDRLGFGMILVIAFSTGLAIVLTAIGVLMICARKVFERFSFEARMPQLLPVASALIISIFGVLIVFGALRDVGIV